MKFKVMQKMMIIIKKEITRLVNEIWRRKILILALMIVISAGIGYKEYRAFVNYKAQMEGEAQYNEIQLSKIEMDANKQYKKLREEIESKRERYDNSILLNYCGYGKPIEIINFSLSNEDNKNKELQTLQGLYEQYISSEKFIEKIGEQGKFELKNIYIGELIKAFKIDENGHNFSLRVAGKTEEQIKEIAEIAKELILTYKVEEIRELGNYQIAYIDEESTTDKTYEVNKERILLRKEIEASELELNQLKEHLTKKQLRALIKEGVALDPISENVIPSTSIKRVVARGLAIGAFAGLFLGFIFTIAYYYMSDVIKSKFEWEEIYGIPLIEEIGKKVSQACMVNICCKIKYLMNNNEAKKIVIVFSVEDKSEHILKDLLKDNLKLNVGEEYIFVKDNEDNFCEVLEQSDAVVLIQQIGKTKNETVKKELKEIALFNKKLLGAVLVN